MTETPVSSRIIKTEPISWMDLEFIQQENFKEWVPSGNQKLQDSLLKYQFIDPFKVWEQNGKLYCLDGRHRFLDLNHLKETGVEIPDMLPATFIDCENIKEAAELVLVYSSQYAKITDQGLFDFVSKFELELPELEGIMLGDIFDYKTDDIPFPDELTAEKKDAPPTLKITFQDTRQLEKFKKELDGLLKLDEFSNINYSVSQGEL